MRGPRWGTSDRGPCHAFFTLPTPWQPWPPAHRSLFPVFLCTLCPFPYAKLSHGCARLMGLDRNVDQHSPPKALEPSY